MSDALFPNGTDPTPRWEAQLAALARALPYPPTPNLAPAVVARTGPGLPAALARRPAPTRRRSLGWAWAALLVALAVAALTAVPTIRAGLATIIEIGVVRIFLGPTPTALVEPAATGTRQPTPTPRPTATALASVLDLSGPTTLAEARERVQLPIVLPAYPAGLGEPDAVYVQDLEGEAVVMVWVQPGDPARVRLSLHILSSDLLVDKLLKDNPAGVQFTRVNGREAFWTTGPYYLVNRRGDYTETRLIEGHVLIWYDRTLTYRLETDLPLEEAVKIAESLE